MKLYWGRRLGCTAVRSACPVSDIAPDAVWGRASGDALRMMGRTQFRCLVGCVIRGGAMGLLRSQLTTRSILAKT
jgi:hypothetical protein